MLEAEHPGDATDVLRFMPESRNERRVDLMAAASAGDERSYTRRR